VKEGPILFFRSDGGPPSAISPNGPRILEYANSPDEGGNQ